MSRSTPSETADRQNHDSLEGLLERIRKTDGDGRQVTVREILDAAGTRSFGPVAVLAGLVVLAPLVGDLPGVPTLMGMLVILTVGQRLFRRNYIWLPGWLSQRQVPRDKLHKGLALLRKPARFLDRFTAPRLTWLMTGGGNLLLALACLVVALALPLMEFVPFSANGGGLALMTFGLAMIARDGVVAVLALVFSGGTLGFIGWQLASNF
ncbi:exopolysaccharide biosynthesis protein [Marinobacter lacisalsi]|uniref:Exopolysaccharide biosynthesis protein n=1 Tax=Marinobacter lacisalsi TaxID=475979 RepID=A0ABV8QD51_9GAMM